MSLETEPKKQEGETLMSAMLKEAGITTENVDNLVAQEAKPKSPKPKKQERKKEVEILGTINFKDGRQPLDLKKGSIFFVNNNKYEILNAVGKKEDRILNIRNLSIEDASKRYDFKLSVKQLEADFNNEKKREIGFAIDSKGKRRKELDKFFPDNTSVQKNQDKDIKPAGFIDFKDGRPPLELSEGLSFFIGNEKYTISKVTENKDGERVFKITNPKRKLNYPISEKDFIKNYYSEKHGKIAFSPSEKRIVELEKIYPPQKTTGSAPAEKTIKFQKDISLKEKTEASIEEIAELFKKYPINQVVIHALENQEPKEGAGLTFHPDLDTQGALYILNELNKKNLEPTEDNPDQSSIYASDAVTSLIIKGGGEDSRDEKRDGIVVFVDVGGSWLEVTEKGKTKIVKIDHHGEGKGGIGQTSATEMMYKIMKKADLLKEDPPWLSEMIGIINNTDNLLYAGERKDGERIFTEDFFTKKWPNSIYAIAEDLPFEVFQELVKSGKIKNTSEPFSEDDFKNDIGKISWDEVWEKENLDGIKEKLNKKSIVDLCKEKEKQAGFTIRGLKEALKYCKENGIETENTELGRIIYHNFARLKNGTKNKIPYNLAYLGARAMNYDTFLMYQDEDENLNRGKKFFGNSKHPNFPKFIERMKKTAKGTANVRDALMFSPKDSKAMQDLTEKKFLDEADTKIAKNAKLKTSYAERKKEENLKIQKLYPQIDDEILEQADEDFKTLEINNKQPKYKNFEKISIAINSNKKENYIVIRHRKGHYLLYKENEVDSKKGFQFLLSKDPREGQNPALIICSEREIENWSNLDTSNVNKEININKVDTINKEIFKLQEKIKSLMDGMPSQDINDLDNLKKFYTNLPPDESLVKALAEGDKEKINRIQKELYEKSKNPIT